MVSNDPTASKPSPPPPGSKAGAAGDSTECARKPIEPGPDPDGTTNDPGAIDRKPPGAVELDLFLG
jgi:hypothetical protein